MLFLYTDEQAWRTLAAYGNTRLAMPNLNRLASRSAVFERAYVTQPVCTPSRSTLLTGLYPHANQCLRNNVRLPADIPCLPEMLPEGVYRTAHMGKWHLGDELYAQHGFQEWVTSEDGYNRYDGPGRDPARRSDYHHFLISRGISPEKGDMFGRGEVCRLPEELGKPAFLAGEACRFLERNRTNPFCLFVNFLEPHMPYHSPRNDQYDPAEVDLPDNFGAAGDAAPVLKTRLLREQAFQQGHSGMPLQSEADWRRMIAHYWGLCSLVDTHMGRILAKLEELGLDDNTLVVFTSDHGDMMGSHGLIAKCVPFEEASRVPLLIRTPGGKPGRVSGPVSQVDVVPTILDCLGVPAPAGLQGASLKPAMESGRAEPPDGGIVFEWNGADNGIEQVTRKDPLPDWMTALAPAEAIRAAFSAPSRTFVGSDGWKLTWHSAGEHELYDLNTDPGERTNLFGRPGMAERAARMVARIRAWQARVGDTVELPALP
jgi:arylsulfatase A-like enzyme